MPLKTSMTKTIDWHKGERILLFEMFKFSKKKSPKPKPFSPLISIAQWKWTNTKLVYSCGKIILLMKKWFDQWQQYIQHCLNRFREVVEYYHMIECILTYKIMYFSHERKILLPSRYCTVKTMTCLNVWV